MAAKGTSLSKPRAASPAVFASHSNHRGLLFFNGAPCNLLALMEKERWPRPGVRSSCRFSVTSSPTVADGEDVRNLPLTLRKTNLSRLFARRVYGIFLSNFEQGEIGPDLYRHACLMGLEGLVSKHKESPYRAGRSPH